MPAVSESLPNRPRKEEACDAHLHVHAAVVVLGDPRRDLGGRLSAAQPAWRTRHIMSRMISANVLFPFSMTRPTTVGNLQLSHTLFVTHRQRRQYGKQTLRWKTAA